MAKSLRSKRKKRLRTLRREIAEPFYEKQDAAKLAAQSAALAAPKLPVRIPTAVAALTAPVAMDLEMAVAEGSSNAGGSELSFLKPVGGVGKKKLKKKLELKKVKRKGKGKFKKKNL